MLSKGKFKQTASTKLLYDGDLVVGIADQNDRQVFSLEYNSDAQIKAISDLSGHRVEYAYTNGLLSSVKNALGEEAFYEYNSEKLLLKKVDTAGRATDIIYQAGRPISVTKSSGNGFFFEYDYDSNKKEYYSNIRTSSGKIKEVWSNQSGETKRVDFNGKTVLKKQKDGRDIIITDEKGNETRKIYDEWDNLGGVLYPDNSKISFEYDHRFQKIISSVDRLGNVTTYNYDEYGNLLEKKQAVGSSAERVSQFSYDSQHRLVTITQLGDANTLSTSSQLTYNSSGNIASVTDSSGEVVEFLSYDLMGNPLKKKDKRGFIWHYNYDAKGQLLSLRNPLNKVNRFEYDSVGNLIAVVDAAGHRSELEYNERDHLTKAFDALGNVSELVYNSDDLPVQVVDAEGKSSFTEFDDEGRLLRSIDGAGNETVPHYDESNATYASSSVPIKVDYPTYSQRRYYDKSQRLVKATDVLDDNTSESVSYNYDVAGRITSQTDKEGKISYFEYDALSRLIKTTDALGGVTELSYDARNNVLAVKDANGGVTRFVYDLNDNKVKEVRPEGQETRYEYDAAGNLTAKLDAKGQRITYQYDALSSLIDVNYNSV